jgi:DNA topoisomerase-1
LPISNRPTPPSKSLQQVLITTSPSISKEALHPIQEEITKKYGETLYKYREYKSKNASAQEAHECIRPTHIEHDNDDNSLYMMIWKRTMAALMQPAQYQVFQITVTTDDPNITFKGEIERLSSPGFLLVYNQLAEEEITLDSTTKSLKLKNLRTEEKISSPPSRYGEASLVKELEKLEIGRPSTYAALITKIKDRKYIEEKDHDGKKYDQKTFKLIDKKSFLPKDIEFLIEHK